MESTDVNTVIHLAIQERFPSLKKSILSLPFLLINFHFSLGLFCFVIYLSKLKDRLDALFKDNDKLIEHLLTVSSIFTMCGFVIAPLSGLLTVFSQKLFYAKASQLIYCSHGTVTNKKLYYTFICGFAIPKLIMSIFTILTFVLTFIPNKIAIYCSFICLVFLRSLLATSTITFLLTCFPIRYYGTLDGILCICGCVFGLLQYTFINISSNIVNGVATGFAACLLIPPIVLFIEYGIICSLKKRFFLP